MEDSVKTIFSIFFLFYLGAFAIYSTSSSIERGIYAKLENYFTSRFNKDIWAIDIADRCKQSVILSLSARSSQVYITYQRMLDQNRKTLSEISAGSEELTSQINYFKDINSRIEALLKSCSEIKL